MTHVLLRGLSGVALAQAAAAPSSPTRTLWDYIQAGGFIGWLLVTLSIAAVALVILSFVKQRMGAWAPPEDVEALTRLVRAGDVEGARRYCGDPAHASFVTSVIGMAFNRCARSPVGLLELRAALEEAGQIEADRKYRLNDGLQLIAAIGPMLGLLGTVIALIVAFTSISQFEGAARSRELADAMSLALVNTAEGLSVAIPATAFYFYFKRRIDRLATDTGLTVEAIVAPLEQRAGVLRPAAPRPAPQPQAPQAPAAAPAPIGPERGVAAP